MERDKLIAIALILGIILLIAAFFGIIVLTGVFLYFTNTGTVENTNSSGAVVVSQVPILEDSTYLGTNNSNNPTNTNPTANDTNNTANKTPSDTTVTNENTETKGTDDPPKNEPPKPPAPVCGNGVKEDGEQCEVDSECSSIQECNSSCICVDLPVEEIPDIRIDKLRFFCAPDFNGKKGLAINRISFVNSTDQDYTHTGSITITSEAAAVNDSVTTNSGYNFHIPAGGQLDLYGANLTRTTAPYLFAGSEVVPLLITVHFADDRIISYNYNLGPSDFEDTVPSCT